MAHNTFKIKSILTVFVLCFLCAGQPIGAASPPASDTTAKPVTPEKDDSKGAGDQLAVQFSEEEIQAIAEALPDGEARQMFNQKVAKGEGLNDAAFDEESVRSGEEFAVLLLDGVKAFSRAQERLVSFFTQPTSTIDTREWAAAFNNLNLGRGRVTGATINREPAASDPGHGSVGTFALSGTRAFKPPVEYAGHGYVYFDHLCAVGHILP
jgi:hypothetical protein